VSTRPFRFLTYGNVMATLALFFALGGTGYAATQLAKNSVGTRQIKKSAVTNVKLASGAVTASKVKTGSLTAPLFAPGTLLKGNKGDPGDKGDTGPSDGYATPSGSGSSQTSETVYASLALPAGSYLVHARVQGAPAHADTNFYCYLRAASDLGTDLDFFHLALPTATSGGLIMGTLQAGVTLAGSDTVEILCRTNTAGDYFVFGARMDAIKVGTLH